ncbi:hypothetical protein IVB12_05385 [Bradyrhizobium sp. 179]|uniref:hypothetical protein n=1 Tax=Bradyrhizobium sp. 179 TaxID=2782648 RepID=UPI001FF986A7|nr:hypothetical protein [Bradyrhizobium sp. 179]MCK1541424.1 hypothetical protein [Bradyrhizobium sp. 179]
MAQQLSFEDYAARQAMQARDIGMIEAEFAEALVSDFGEVAYAAICHVARRQAEVHVDDVLRFCKVKPSHPNAWGAVWMRAIKDGVIARTGRVRPCLSDPGKHKHQYPIYASGVFHGRAA